MNAFAGPLFPMLKEMYPDATYMFNTRLPMGTMASYAQGGDSIKDLNLKNHFLEIPYFGKI